MAECGNGCKPGFADPTTGCKPCPHDTFSLGALILVVLHVSGHLSVKQIYKSSAVNSAHLHHRGAHAASTDRQLSVDISTACTTLVVKHPVAGC